MAAHYQVTDLVVRRDWYSLASVFAAGEVTETELKSVLGLVSNVGLDELALLDAQLQLAGLGRAIMTKELSRANERIAIASALELSRRRYYLQSQFTQDESFEAAYRRTIEKKLRQAVSYSYTAKDSSITLRETHRLLDAIKQGIVTADERADALMVILRRDPLLLTRLVDDGFVSLRDAGYALDETPIAPVDAIRLIVSLPELITDTRLVLFVSRIDLGAIAQLRDEISNTVVRGALNDRAALLLSEAVKNENENVSRYGALYGSEYAYTDIRQEQLLKLIVGIEDESLVALRDFIEVVDVDNGVRALRTIPVMHGHDVVEIVQFVMMLGVRFDWASELAERLFTKWGQTWLTEAQRVGLLNDEVSILGARERSRFDHINGRLVQFATQFVITAHELLLHAPSLKNYTEKITSGRALHRNDLTILAYLSADDSELRAQVVRRLDERAFGELLSGAIDGSSLAKGFWRSIDNADVLYIMLRWGSRTRNGYLLRLIADVSPKRYGELYREAEVRGLAVMTRGEIDSVLAVLAETREVASSVTSEQSIAFVDQLVKTYGGEQAGQFVRAAGIRHAKELEHLSPFYVKLLIDMYDEGLAINRLRGLEKTLTYERAQEIRGEYYKEKQSFASEVVASLQRSLKAQVSAPQQIVTEVV
ncbi:MAG: hypothetical protein WBP12_05245 [Candidatus Saccharimonas sp.]